MKIKIEKERLLEAINTVSRAVPTRTTVSILECMLIEAKDDSLKLLANNLEIGIETKEIQAEIEEPGKVAIESRIFSEIIRKFPEGVISIETDKKHITTLKCGGAKYKILGLSGEEFPPLPNVEKSNGIPISAGQLKNMIRQTIFSVSQDETRGVMTGELITLKDNMLNLVSTDGLRISVRTAAYTKNEEAPNSFFKAVIPGKILNEIGKILSSKDEDTVLIYTTDKHALFELDNCIVVTRLLSGDFINYENIFTKDCTSLIYVDRIELLEAIERASLMSKDAKKNPIVLNAEEGLLTVESETEMGTAHEELAAQLDGQPIEIAFNPRYLADILKVIDEERVQLNMTTRLSPCVFRSDENDGFKYLVMPLRTKK